MDAYAIDYLKVHSGVNLLSSVWACVTRIAARLAMAQVGWGFHGPAASAGPGGSEFHGKGGLELCPSVDSS